ncbi:hypothetical protein PHYBLDRAFT_144127 [Phycomyces blakesleeanus NRRL 1555(-)]|uniref:Uncharacterized protein n=1 Tax=Phycomyces blakesleeanus (strain ATCC 8743b / DSM 1359 / FGSC 10004 / NBRC 33097 / NRRL 1555) TaxID=763407 RepID=A0A162UAE1_PHYB8|nr:hypothetical protein PHYBLDRAFT_144127 [Phycomyces blakesleeanus NRRL 1555(-)]OAD74762.1 hypothetical protein PHYBLDRAFT_144127 [Phycomyces blakesleeanus NRRL 1555(-)]|eukprot:XP_018292802.1 hypothetical protein PHYBLDRAFT_144127 [Phycomyces blakesleeanus NRRL 1555(-)]
MLFIDSNATENLFTGDEESQKTKAKKRSRKCLNLKDLSNTECKQEFRFTLPEPLVYK